MRHGSGCGLALPLRPHVFSLHATGAVGTPGWHCRDWRGGRDAAATAAEPVLHGTHGRLAAAAQGPRVAQGSGERRPSWIHCLGVLLCACEARVFSFTSHTCACHRSARSGTHHTIQAEVFVVVYMQRVIQHLSLSRICHLPCTMLSHNQCATHALVTQSVCVQTSLDCFPRWTRTIYRHLRSYNDRQRVVP